MTLGTFYSDPRHIPQLHFSLSLQMPSIPICRIEKGSGQPQICADANYQNREKKD